MTTMKSSAARPHFEAFEYRLLYLRPTPYSDERIVVGLIADTCGTLEARFISSVAAIELMSRLFGDDGVEQFQFAAGEIRRNAAGLANLDALSLPTDLIVTGESQRAFTHDRGGLLTSVLASASCLVRSGESRSTEVLDAVANVQFSADLFDQLSRLNPLVANQIFDHQITVESGKVVQLPILGKRIFGAPVSFAARDHRMRAEAYVAKFNWLRSYLAQEPRIYLLAPQPQDRVALSRLDPGIRELQAIAKAAHLTSKVADSTEEMATLILEDEAA